MAEDIRWLQRFQNFEKALVLLREGAERKVDGLSDLEKEGLVRRFKYTWELAWKTLKDYLEFHAVCHQVDKPCGLLQHSGKRPAGAMSSRRKPVPYAVAVTPRSVIKAGYAAQILQDGQLWVDMLASRNQMAHLYDSATFERAVEEISSRYLPAFEALYAFLQAHAP